MTWLIENFNAFWGWIEAVWTAFVTFLTDLPKLVLKGILDGIATLIEAIPIPDFMANGLGGIFQAMPSSLVYFLDRSSLVECFGIIGAATAFRITRKFVTLFQW